MLLQAYQTQWPANFEAIRKQLKQTLGHLPITIEHIGSTAVPHLAAKPIIDIDIVFEETSLFDKIKTGLERIGYFHNGNQGIIDREVFKRKKWLFKHQILDNIAHHLYVCPSHSIELQRHLAFRNFLRNHEEARLQYQELKLQIAEETNHIKKHYAELKELKARQFIEECLLKAQKAASN